MGSINEVYRNKTKRSEIKKQVEESAEPIPLKSRVIVEQHRSPVAAKDSV
jgi:hypothetical protein